MRVQGKVKGVAMELKASEKKGVRPEDVTLGGRWELREKEEREGTITEYDGRTGILASGQAVLYLSTTHDPSLEYPLSPTPNTAGCSPNFIPK